ncbi:MAG: hypothetical protein AAB495_02535 [Patescibacteria group bacterium]
MMTELIVSTVFMIAVGVLVYLVVRTIPRIDEGAGGGQRTWERWFTAELPEKLDGVTNAFLVKFFRKAKVVVLKLDNFLNRELKRVRPEDGIAAAQKPDFKDLAGEQAALRERKDEAEKN